MTIHCPACEDDRTVIREIRHDGRDCVDKKGHYEQVRVPCPECVDLHAEYRRKIEAFFEAHPLGESA